MSVRLTYELAGAGWADCTIAIDGQAVTVSASYLSDALDDLAAALIAVVRGDESASAEFAEEPGDYRWDFRREGIDQLRIRVYWSLPWWNGAPHEPDVPLFDARCNLRTFAGQLLSELQRLIAQPGEAGYRDQWIRFAFPAQRLATLESLLENP